MICHGQTRSCHPEFPSIVGLIQCYFELSALYHLWQPWPLITPIIISTNLHRHLNLLRLLLPRLSLSVNSQGHSSKVYEANILHSQLPPPSPPSQTLSLNLPWECHIRISSDHGRTVMLLVGYPTSSAVTMLPLSKPTIFAEISFLN